MIVEEMLTQMDYKDVLYYFTEISKIPRGSGNNQGISDYIVKFAKEKGLRFLQDEALNVIIYKDSAKGYESHDPIILQGHMDMVCVKEEGSPHNFETDALVLKIDGDYLFADRTTLGADDGIAIAYCMALLADNTILHPALEIVITTDEETGMDGAMALNASILNGKIMINLDSEDEDICLVSCAGGKRLNGELNVQRTKVSGIPIKIVLKGLKGGHSGIDINKCRTNATLLMARLLMDLKEETKIWLISMKGGCKDNAIPAVSEAELIANSGSDEENTLIIDRIREICIKLRNELSASEPFFEWSIEVGVKGSYQALHMVSFEKNLYILLQAPNGVQVMDSNFDYLVESSLNLGIYYLDEERAVYQYSIRSSVESYIEYLTDKIIYLIEFLGGSCKSVSGYPAWEYKQESRIRKIYKEVYESNYLKKPKFEAIHAGLECGIISGKIPELDIIAVGPILYDIHTPMERVSISSMVNFYKFLEKLLASL